MLEKAWRPPNFKTINHCAYQVLPVILSHTNVITVNLNVLCILKYSIIMNLLYVIYLDNTPPDKNVAGAE